MTEQSDANVDINDLENFSNELFGVTETNEHQETDGKVEEEEVPETELETQEDEDASAETEDEGQEEEEVQEEPKPKKAKKSFKERIDELTAEKYQARREVDLLRQELEKLKVRPQEEVQEKPAEQPLRDKLPSDAPKPDAVNDKGEPLYVLGEFDPQYIADLTRYTITNEMKEADAKRQAAEKQREVELAHAALQQHWQENLEAVEEELPDIRESISSMVDVFSGIEPNYGEYLAGTIMSCDHGPEIMYYLSKNIGEAQQIVASGPTAATLAIGRLEAQLDKSNKQEAPKSNKRVSDAPPPPESRSRGTGGKYSVRGDTDNLAAFERDFFNHK